MSYVIKCMYMYLITLIGEDKSVTMICPHFFAIHHYKSILCHFYGRSMSRFHHFVPCHIKDMNFKWIVWDSENLVDVSIVCEIFQLTTPCNSFLIECGRHPTIICVTVLIDVLYTKMTLSRPNCPQFISLLLQNEDQSISYTHNSKICNN